MGRRSTSTRWQLLLPAQLEMSADGRALVMLRVAAALVALSQVALALPALLTHTRNAALATFFYAFNMCIGLVFVRLTFRRWMLTVWRQVTLLGCICLLA